MGVKFLSEEWASAVQDALNANDQFKSSAGSTTCWILAVVEPAELLNWSFAFSASWTADAHSSDRNLTPIPIPFRCHGFPGCPGDAAGADAGARGSIPTRRL